MKRLLHVWRTSGDTSDACFIKIQCKTTRQFLIQIFLSELSRAWLNTHSIFFLIILHDVHLLRCASGQRTLRAVLHVATLDVGQDSLATAHCPLFYIGKPFQRKNPTKHRQALHQIWAATRTKYKCLLGFAFSFQQKTQTLDRWLSRARTPENIFLEDFVI